MRTKRMQTLARVGTTIMMMIALCALAGAGPAQAYDTYRSGAGVGLHNDAVVSCANSPYANLTATPRLATTTGWERGQNVAWRYHVYSYTTGRYVVAEQTWRTAHIFTVKTTYNFYGMPVTEISVPTYPQAQWQVGSGKYGVYIDYAWQTSAGWSYATAYTTSYTNSSVSLGRWWPYYATTCEVNIVRNV